METEERVRVTLLVPKSLDRKLEIYAAIHDQRKNVVVTEALDDFLKDADLSPDAPPKSISRAAGD